MFRWEATIVYRQNVGSKLVECDLEELADIHDLVEGGDHFDTVEGIFIKRVNHVDSPTPTVEQAKAL